MLEKEVLRRICLPNREVVIGGRRKLHCEELHNFYCTSHTIRRLKSRRMRLKGYVRGMVINNANF